MMENMLSGILAIIIALTSMCGGLMNSGAGQPFTAEISVNVDGDLSMIGGAGQSEEMTAAVTKLLDALSIRLSADENVGQLQMKLDGTPVSSLSVKKQDGGWAAVSTLFPSTLLTVKDETLAAMTAAQADSTAALSVSPEDKEAMLASLLAPVEEMTEAFRQKAGDPETGSFTLGGVEFTKKTPYNVTAKEAFVLSLTAAKKILSDEKIAPFLSQFGQNLSPESLDQTLEDLQGKDDSELPALSVAEYGNEAGDTAFEILMDQDGQSVNVLAVTSGQVTNVTVAAMDQLNASLVLDEENKQYNLDLAFAAEGMAVTLNGSLKVRDEGSDLEIALTMPTGGEKPMSLKIKAAVTAEAPVFEAAEGLNEVALETLMQDNEAAEALNTEIQQALMLQLVKIAKDYPELVSMMAPSDAGQSPVVEEAPAE